MFLGLDWTWSHKVVMRNRDKTTVESLFHLQKLSLCIFWDALRANENYLRLPVRPIEKESPILIGILCNDISRLRFDQSLRYM